MSPLTICGLRVPLALAFCLAAFVSCPATGFAQADDDDAADATPDGQPAEPPAEAEGPWLVLQAAFTGSLGAGPAVGSVGGRLGLELRWAYLSVTLAARGDLPFSVGVDVGGDDGAIEAHVFGGELGFCGRLSPVHVCGVLVAGATRGEGSGFAVDEQSYLPFVALGARAGLELPIAGPFAFFAQLDVLAHLTPAELRVDAEPVWSMPPLSAVLAAGISARLL